MGPSALPTLVQDPLSAAWQTTARGLDYRDYLLSRTALLKTKLKMKYQLLRPNKFTIQRIYRSMRIEYVLIVSLED